MKFLFTFTAFLLLIFQASSFDLKQWNAQNLEKVEYKDRTLYLARKTRKPKTAAIVRKFSKAEIKNFAGKQLVISADVEQLYSDRPDVVGLSLYGKTVDGKRFSKRSSLPFRGKHAPVSIECALDIPENTFTLYASIEAARSWNRAGEALFRNIKLETRAAGSPIWNCGTGSFLSVGKNKLFWNWKCSDGLKAELKNDTFILEGKGTLTLRCQNGKFYELLGSTPEFGAMAFELGTSTPVTIDITSYGTKKTVKLDHITASKNGARRIKIPLSKFAHYHDLVKFEELSFTIDGKQSIRKCRIIDIDLEDNTKNLIPDPSFEEASTPRGNFVSWGDYHSEKLASGLKFSTAEKFHGKRSLEIAPGGFITIQTCDHVGRTAIFSLYAKGNGNFELDFRQQLGKIHGPVAFNIWKKSFTADNSWKRYHFISPLKQKPRAGQSLYIATIRNTGKSPLFIDALQLEQNSTKPTDFKPQRSTDFNISVRDCFPLAPLAEPDELPENPTTGRVSFHAVNQDNVDYQNIPVRGGITFAKGALFDVRCLRVTDKNGREVPAQFTALARRVTTDKSVISVAVDFNTQLKANERKEFFLEYGKKEFKSGFPAIAAQKGDEIHIDTGKLKLVLTPKAASFLRESDAFCAVQSIDGKINRSPAQIVRIDENGPQRATIFLRGTALLAWDLRLTFIKDQPYMMVDYSFENNFTARDSMTRQVRSIFIELPGGSSYKVDSFSGSGNAIFVQRNTRTGYFKRDVYAVHNGKKEVIENLTLSGSGKSGNASFHITDFAELAPRAIGFKDGKIRLYHYPEEGAAFADLFAGISGTMKFNYAPESKSVPLSSNAIIHPDPDHIRQSGVFDEFLTQKEMAKYFPKSKHLIDTTFEGIKRFSKINNYYGFWEYGDFGSRGYFDNHETAIVRNLWVRFLMTGCVDDFKIAEVHARHQRDLDQAHIRYGTTAVHTHNGFNNNSYSFHTGHFWLTGLVWHYLLTGDRRSYESTVSAMAVLISKSSLKYPRGRERHRMLYHLAEIYGITGNKLVKQAMDRQYNHGGKSDGSAYYGAIAYEALEKLYEVTEDKKYLDRMTEEVQRFAKANRTDIPDMPQDRTVMPPWTGYADAGRGVMSILIGARAALRYDRPELIEFLNRGKNDSPLLNRMLDPRSYRSANIAWILGGLYAMKHYNIPEHKNTPDAYHFLAMFAGVQRLFNNYEPFIFEITPDKDGVCTLDLYRFRMFRYWNKKLKDDYVTCKIFSSTGKLLTSICLDGNVTWEHRQIKATSPDRKALRAEIIFNNDSWGSISSPCKIRLSSKRIFGARNTSSAPTAIYIKAPKSGKLSVFWNWKQKNNVSAGEILAAGIETCDGRMLTTKAYTIPEQELAGDFNSTAFTLDIPPEFRGKTVKLYIVNAKWISWQLKGLDYPWLGNRAGDLE
ncbi:MAG: hypothetical protein IJW08_01360 [Lentisphaeria bacterium]|nr:hypothetical protein [Lentisphaeria bacterium]